LFHETEKLFQAVVAKEQNRPIQTTSICLDYFCTLLLLLLPTIIQIQFKQVFAVYCHKKWECLFRYDALGIVSFCWQHFVMTEAGIFHARCNTQFGALACVCSFAPSGRKSPATALR